VIVGEKVAICSKIGAYKIAAMRHLIERAECDFIVLKPSRIVREEPFVLPYVLGFMGLPDLTKWCPPNDPYIVVGVINLARAWNIKLLLNHLSSTLEIPMETMCSGGDIFRLVRSKLRWVFVHAHSVILYVTCMSSAFRMAKYQHAKDQKRGGCCILCGGSWRLPPLRLCTAFLRCCLRDVHYKCLQKATWQGGNCPGCGHPLSVEEVLNRGSTGE